MGKEVNSKPQILIVDDEPAIRDLLTTILKDRCDCTTAESAEQALDILKTLSFSLIISDICMSGMSGIDLVNRVIKASPETVVMVISGNQTIDSPIEAVRSGAFDYIKKPFDIDQVSIAVDRALKHSELLATKRRHEDHLEQLVDERTEKLNYLAYYDSLTGLPNRAFFEEELARALANGFGDGNIALLYISLDSFKELRDTLGHMLGGLLLNKVANRLSRLNAEKLTVARFEGDEFALMLPHSGAEDVAAFAETVFESLKAPFMIGEYEMIISVSIGISLFPENGAEAQILLKNAGAALSHARKQGGNNYQFYTEAIHQAAIDRLALENELRRALNRGEFELYYQPKIDINTSGIVGMEALVRWNHPKRGVVPPQEFIPIAEDTGLIVPMGDWILRSACIQSKLWHELGHRLNVAVNLSACQFQQGDLVERVAATLEETGYDPAFLNLEVTESSIMNNTDTAVKILRGLRETGIKISIDDFGTGHSSLGYLKHLPIDVLKIDKSFVNDVTVNQDDAALVMAIVTLAHTLRLKVVAEGVETEEQLRFLHLLRCDEWQGYLFSKPVPVGAFLDLIE